MKKALEEERKQCQEIIKQALEEERLKSKVTGFSIFFFMHSHVEVFLLQAACNRVCTSFHELTTHTLLHNPIHSVFWKILINIMI